jgi:hypothetical protein
MAKKPPMKPGAKTKTCAKCGTANNARPATYSVGYG